MQEEAMNSLNLTAEDCNQCVVVVVVVACNQGRCIFIVRLFVVNFMRTLAGEQQNRTNALA
jgi:hypothetical protein